MDGRTSANRLQTRPSGYDTTQITCRVVVLGSPGVGKTESIYKNTMEIDEEDVRLEILDTAGNIGDIAKQGYILWADCFVIVYSITDRISFTEACELKKRVDHIRKNNCISVLVGNKTDLVHLRAITENEARERATDELGCCFQEVSACDWIYIAQITDLFMDLYREYRKLKLNKDPRARKTSSSRFKLAIQKVITGRTSPKI